MAINRHFHIENLYRFNACRQTFKGNGVVAVTEKHMPKNYMVDFVVDLLPAYLADHKTELGRYASSPEFSLRVTAAALNMLPAKYFTTPAGAVYSAFSMKEPQIRADVFSALSKASTQIAEQMSI